MSSFDRRTFCLSLLALAGCGYQPVYAPGGSGAALQGRVAARDPESRNEFNFLDAFEQRIGRPQAPAYLLDYVISVGSSGIGTTPADVVTRYTLTGSITFILRDIETGAEVFSGSEQAFTGYSATATQLATDAAARDANERLMTILAERTVTQLYTFTP